MSHASGRDVLPGFPGPRPVQPRFIPLADYTPAFDDAWKDDPLIVDNNIDNPAETYESLVQKTGVRPEDLKGKQVIEVGCGTDRFLKMLHSAGAIMHGMDLSFAIDYACRILKDLDGVALVQDDLNLSAGRLPAAERLRRDRAGQLPDIGARRAAAVGRRTILHPGPVPL